MKCISLIIFLLHFSFANAQITDKMAISADYTYRGRNVLGLGLEFRLNDIEEPALNLATRVLYTRVDQKDKLLPELRVDYSAGHIFHIGASITPYAMEPRIGLNFLNILVINTGYAIPIDINRYFKGVTFGLRWNFSLRHHTRQEFYDHFQMGF